MNQKKPGQRPQRLDTQGIRGLVFALAVSSTIGFWAIFSRSDGMFASMMDNPDPSPDDLPEIHDDNIAAFDLPPIPTLIPTLDAANLAMPNAAMSIPVAVQDVPDTTSLPKITPPSGLNKPARDNSKPAKPKKIRSKSTTSTRSS